VFDGSGNVCEVIFVYDDSDGASNDCVNVTQSKAGATIAVTIPFNVFIGAGDEVSVVAEGVTNSSGTGGTFKLSTSSDPKPVKIKYTLR
jgi:hypothetical protein